MPAFSKLANTENRSSAPSGTPLDKTKKTTGTRECRTERYAGVPELIFSMVIRSCGQ
jgi:hypothetical protein